MTSFIYMDLEIQSIHENGTLYVPIQSRFLRQDQADDLDITFSFDSSADAHDFSPRLIHFDMPSSYPSLQASISAGWIWQAPTLNNLENGQAIGFELALSDRTLERIEKGLFQSIRLIFQAPTSLDENGKAILDPCALISVAILNSLAHLIAPEEDEATPEAQASEATQNLNSSADHQALIAAAVRHQKITPAIARWMQKLSNEQATELLELIATRAHFQYLFQSLGKKPTHKQADSTVQKRLI